MMSESVVIGWVFQYACRHNMHRIIHALYKKFGGFNNFDISHMEIGCALLHKIIHHKECAKFRHALRVVEALWQSFPQEKAHKAYIKLIFGLKSMIALETLQKTPSRAIQDLNSFFPRSSVNNKRGRARNDKVSALETEIGLKFRKKFLALLNHQKMQESFFSDQYPLQYGNFFHKTLSRYMDVVVQEFRSCMPITVLDKILQRGCEHYSPILEQYPCVAMEMLLDTVLGKQKLTEVEILEFIASLSPTDSQMIDIVAQDGCFLGDICTQSDAYLSSRRSSVDTSKHNGSGESLLTSSEDSVSMLNKTSCYRANYKTQVPDAKQVIVISSDDNSMSHDLVSNSNHESIGSSLTEKNDQEQLYEKGNSQEQREITEIETSTDLSHDISHDMSHDVSWPDDPESSIVPPSENEHLEISDVFELNDALPGDMLPSIQPLELPTNMKFCIVKLHRNKLLEQYMKIKGGEDVKIYE